MSIKCKCIIQGGSMKRKSKLQTPYTPLILMVIIIMGYILGGGSKNTENTTADNIVSDVISDEQENQNDRDTDIGNIEENSIGQNDTELGNTLSNNDSKNETDANRALKEGRNISGEIEDTYAIEIADKYINRKVISTEVSDLVREKEGNIYRQSFTIVSGYMNLVRLNSEQETIANLTVSTDLKAVTVLLVFPDQSYVVIEPNAAVECRLPKGASTILYIGEKLSGSIEVEVEENELVSSQRL